MRNLASATYHPFTWLFTCSMCILWFQNCWPIGKEIYQLEYSSMQSSFALTFTYSTHSQSYLGQYLLSLFRGIVSHVSFCLFVSYISNTVRIIITFHILFWNLLIFWMIFFNWCALRFSLVVKFYEFWQIYCHVLAITISHKIVSPF